MSTYSITLNVLLPMFLGYASVMLWRIWKRSYVMPKDRKGNEIKPPPRDQKYNDKDQENDRERIRRENEDKRKK